MRRLFLRLFQRELDLLARMGRLPTPARAGRRPGRIDASPPSRLRPGRRRRTAAEGAGERVPPFAGLRKSARAVLSRGAPFVTYGTSVLIHAAIILLLLGIRIDRPGPQDDFKIQLTLAPPRAAPPRPLEKKKEEPKPTPPPAAPAPDPGPPVSDPDPALPPGPILPDAPGTSEDPGAPGTGDVPRSAPEGREGPPAVLGVGDSPPPGEGQGRGGEGEGDGFGSRSRGKGGALARYGGSAATEDAVARGLAWLACHQDADGGWSAANYTLHCHHFTQCFGKGLEEFDTGLTALATLAFLGSGQVPGGPGRYGAAVEKALDSLIAAQRGDGAIGAKGDKYMYNHAIAAFAIGEAFGITRDPKYLKPFLSALAFTESSQQTGGGWDYLETATGRNDLSITGWQVMALRAAETAGVPVSGGTLSRLRSFLVEASTPAGEGVYADRGMGAGRRGVNMSAVLLLAKLYTGTALGDHWVAVAADRLIHSPPETERLPDWDSYHQSSYYWYYASLSLFHLGGKRWEAWNHFLVKSILFQQSRAPHEDGSWPPDPNWVGAMGGRVFTTAMNVLTLEVYYRYPPLHSYRTKVAQEGAVRQGL